MRPAKYSVISVVGAHAGEDLTAILARKQSELAAAGAAHWLLHSSRARVPDVQSLGARAAREGERVAVYFIGAATKGGAQPTSIANAARELSLDGAVWEQVPAGTRVTGRITPSATAIVLSSIEPASGELDLWDFSDRKTGQPVRPRLGASTICCLRAPAPGLASRFRPLLAIGYLADPFARFVR